MFREDINMCDEKGSNPTLDDFMPIPIDWDTKALFRMGPRPRVGLAKTH